MRVAETEASCVIRTAATVMRSPVDVATDLKRQLAGGDYQHLVVFFSAQHDAIALNAALGNAFPGVPVSGCTTAGEISSAGMLDGSVVVVAFPKEGFRVIAGVIEDVGHFGVERANVIVRQLRAQFECSPARGGIFALMLVDGLSNCEETLVAAIHWAIDDIQLIGGSAGDSLAFQRTALIHEGRVWNDAAILIMIESAAPFRAFKTQNFEPTSIKLVVTAADTENRIVYELNAEPAAREYAAAIGLLPDDLGPFSFASYPLVVRVGGDYYCRSIRNMNADGSLSFFCAIDEGLVFTVARPRDMLQSTANALADIDKALGGVDVVLGFDCILRRLDAENRQIRHQMERLYCQHKVVGFHTYGEQFNAMHLNQTLTGIAFGRGRPNR